MVNNQLELTVLCRVLLQPVLVCDFNIDDDPIYYSCNVEQHGYHPTLYATITTPPVPAAPVF